MLGSSLSELGYQERAQMTSCIQLDSRGWLGGLQVEDSCWTGGCTPQVCGGRHTSLLNHLTHNKRHETRNLGCSLPDLLSELWG